MPLIAVLGLRAPARPHHTAGPHPPGSLLRLRAAPAVLALVALGALAGCGAASAPPESPSATYAQPGYGGASAGASSTMDAHVQMEAAPADSDGERESVGFAADQKPSAPPPPSQAPVAAKKATDASSTAGSSGAPSNDQSAEREASSAKDAPHDAAMLIYTAHITMAVYQVEPGLASVEQIARDLGGYLANRSDTEITVRIPRGRFDEAMRRVGLTGDVVHRDVSAQDVTDQVVDLEVRLKNARNLRDRLAELLTRADVKNALEIEKELGRVTGEIEQMEGKLKLLRDQIAYSTITVSFQSRGPGALRDVPLRLPFPWLQDLGLSPLLSLHQ